MAAIGHVFTLARVAAMLGEDEDWLHEISLDLDPEDGVLAVYGPGDAALGVEPGAQIADGEQRRRHVRTAARRRRAAPRRGC